MFSRGLPKLSRSFEARAFGWNLFGWPDASGARPGHAPDVTVNDDFWHITRRNRTVIVRA